MTTKALTRAALARFSANARRMGLQKTAALAARMAGVARTRKAGR